jgi:hypothetical protein
MQQRNAAAPEQQQQQQSCMEIPPWHEQLLQKGMPGALQVQLPEHWQRLLLTPFVALLRMAQDAQRQVQQQQQQQEQQQDVEAVEPSEVDEYFNMLLLPTLMELLLLCPSDAALAYNVLLLVVTAWNSDLMGARHIYVWTRVMQCLLQQLGPQLVKTLSNSSSNSSSSSSSGCDAIQELQLAFGQLMTLLTDSGGQPNRHTRLCLPLFV